MGGDEGSGGAGVRRYLAMPDCGDTITGSALAFEEGASVLRLHPDVRAELVRVAYVNGRSLSKEIAVRLEASLKSDAAPAPTPTSAPASYTTPIQYQGYDCAQLTAEAQRTHGRVNQLAGRLDEAANNDKVIMGVGMVLTVPAEQADKALDILHANGEPEAYRLGVIAEGEGVELC